MSLAIIPARSGSKRIKNKNIKFLSGKPIICHAINLAKKTKLFSRIIVSTDSKKIAKISKLAGAEIFFLRPKKLSNEKAPVIDVVSHAIKFLKKKKISYKYTCCIFPVSPLLSPKIIKDTKKIITKNKLNYVFPVTKKTHSNQNPIMIDKNNKIGKKSKYSSRHYDAGQFYWGKTTCWENKNKIFGDNTKVIKVNSNLLIDVNYISDWKKMEKRFNKKDK